MKNFLTLVFTLVQLGALPSAAEQEIFNLPSIPKTLPGAPTEAVQQKVATPQTPPAATGRKAPVVYDLSKYPTQVWQQIPDGLNFYASYFTAYDMAYLEALSKFTTSKQRHSKLLRRHNHPLEGSGDKLIPPGSSITKMDTSLTTAVLVRGGRGGRPKGTTEVFTGYYELNIRYRNCVNAMENRSPRPTLVCLSRYMQLPPDSKVEYADNTLRVTAPANKLHELSQVMRTKGFSVSEHLADCSFNGSTPNPDAALYLYINLNQSTIHNLTSNEPGFKTMRANLRKLIARANKSESIEIVILTDDTINQATLNKTLKSLKLSNRCCGTLKGKMHIPDPEDEKERIEGPATYRGSKYLSEFYFPHGVQLPLYNIPLPEDSKKFVTCQPEPKVLHQFIDSYLKALPRHLPKWNTTEGPLNADGTPLTSSTDKAS